ncbi:cold-shock protein, partial [Neisseria sp. P0014.S008]
CKIKTITKLFDLKSVQGKTVTYNNIHTYIMRYYGTITRWNSKRGYGAATIEDTGQEIFHALAACTTLTPLPAEGQHISFNI